MYTKTKERTTSGDICPYCGAEIVKYYPGGKRWWKVLLFWYEYHCPYCDT